jgi:hypothetical protein
MLMHLKNYFLSIIQASNNKYNMKNKLIKTIIFQSYKDK